jgi:hypothetical protein
MTTLQMTVCSTPTTLSWGSVYLPPAGGWRLNNRDCSQTFLVS